jgi:ArsR family transcriptional regulator
LVKTKHGHHPPTKPQRGDNLRLLDHNKNEQEKAASNQFHDLKHLVQHGSHMPPPTIPADGTPALATLSDPATPQTGLATNAARAASFLKSLSHEGRLSILCHLCDGEKTVSEIETILGLRQATVSQLLARLREDGLVQTRRTGKLVHYSLADTRTKELITHLHQMFCAPNVHRD